MSFFLCVIGMVMVVEGVPYFTAPSGMKNLISMLLTLDDKILRGFGGFLMISGVIIVYMGKYFS